MGTSSFLTFLLGNGALEPSIRSLARASALSVEAGMPGSADGGDAVSVATAQATVVAIFAAIGVGYFAIAYERLYGMRHELIERANAVGRQRANVMMGHPLADHGYDGTDGYERWRLTSTITGVVQDEDLWTRETAGASPEDRVLDPIVPPRGQNTERVGYLIASLSLLMNNYPLAGDSFTTLEQVRKWLPDALIASKAVLYPLQRSASYVAQLVGEVPGRDYSRPGQGAAARAYVEYLARVSNPASQFEHLYSGLTEIVAELSQVDSELRRYDGYRARLPRRLWVWVGFAAATLAFLSGVLLPLIDTHMPRALYVGIPVALYACALTVAGCLVLKGSYDT